MQSPLVPSAASLIPLLNGQLSTNFILENENVVGDEEAYSEFCFHKISYPQGIVRTYGKTHHVYHLLLILCQHAKNVKIKDEVHSFILK